MKEIFYTADLMGGLGNQMFQIAHAYAQSKRSKVDLKFRKKSKTNNQGNTPEKYLKNIYRNIKFEDFDNTDLIHRSNWDFKEISPNPNYSIEFQGYFQSSKNFYGYDKEIKNLFHPSSFFIEKINLKYNNIINDKNIIIHIRRGDYLKFPYIHPVIDVSYIEKCLEQINNFKDIYIVTDDKSWVKQNLKFIEFKLVDDLEDYEDLWLLSLFKNIIMSNSSFSWWGSFLNCVEDPNIFVPNMWFGPNGEKNIDDIYEKNWKKINVNFESGKLVCY